jgi:hypothetical protein
MMNILKRSVKIKVRELLTRGRVEMEITAETTHFYLAIKINYKYKDRDTILSHIYIKQFFKSASFVHSKL